MLYLEVPGFHKVVKYMQSRRRNKTRKAARSSNQGGAAPHPSETAIRLSAAIHSRRISLAGSHTTVVLSGQGDSADSALAAALSQVAASSASAARASSISTLNFASRRLAGESAAVFASAPEAGDGLAVQFRSRGFRARRARRGLGARNGRGGVVAGLEPGDLLAALARLRGAGERQSQEGEKRNVHGGLPYRPRRGDLSRRQRAERPIRRGRR